MARSIPPTSRSFPILGGALSLSLDLVEVIGRSGLAIAPRHPTPPMVRAGSDAGQILPATATHVYEAMVRAYEMG